MKRLSNTLLRFARDEQGTETLEWGLVCGLIVVGAIAAIALIGPKVTAMWNNINTKIP
ncbi:MAG: Flp family type IVb pilin [Anaerolineae bacterium]|nr:Flp family type IVb pilin [Phycisphaerae bacterium]